VRRASWILILLGLAACGPKKKIEECQALVAAINDGVDRIHKTMSGPPDAGESVSELRALATEMDNIAKAADAVNLTTPELVKLSQRYQDLTKEVATAARELADAVAAVDVEKRDKLQTRMEETVKREDPLVEDLNKFCQSP
jgi:methyl-accepting chemotaxis protein